MTDAPPGRLPPEPARVDGSRRRSLTTRILAVNIFVILLLVGGFLYLDSYRARLIETRLEGLAREAMMLDAALDRVPGSGGESATLSDFARIGGTRVRSYGPDGALLGDSQRDGFGYRLRDPAIQPWYRQVARGLDRAVDAVVFAERPADFQEPARDIASSWPELTAAARTPGRPRAAYRFAPDRTPMLSVALASGERRLLIVANARDVTRTVRAERSRLGIVLIAVSALSILLSLFLARTIVRPLRRLAEAAIRVRQGRAREVVVPRLPSRRDEIGMLARALSDMTGALRARIDAGEAFAADVAHELKNPLASLRSALDGLETITDPGLRRQLADVAHDDVRRLDRLISDIAEASRVDAELSRTRFETIDVGGLIEPILAGRRARAGAGAPGIAFARPRTGAARVLGERSRLARVIENLLDNALSFSPPGGVVRIGATCDGGDVVIWIEDDGPGVPADQREAIFRRFHSVRPEGDGFARHSGLGLAIARSIVEAHDGRIRARDRDDAARGACFEIRLPAAPAA